MNWRYVSWALVALGLAAALFQGVRWRQEAAALRRELAEAMQGVSGDRKVAVTRQSHERDRLQQRVDGLARLVEEEREALQKARESVKGLEERLPDNPEEITASYGRVQDLGRNFGDAVRVLVAISPEMQKEWPDIVPQSEVAAAINLVSWIPRVHLLESRPDEIATFHSEALRKVFELEPEVVEDVRTHIERQFSQMRDAELLAENQPPPDDGAPDEGRVQWERRRAEALTELMNALRPLLPDDKPNTLQFALPGLLNLGLGMNPISSQPDAQILSLPSWPTVPRK